MFSSFQVSAAQPTIDARQYLINPGDIISIHVWNEESLSRPQVLVRPDGMISVPIVGEVKAGGLSPEAVSQGITQKLLKFVRDEPVVTVSTLALNGNAVFLVGQVNKPGKYIMQSNLDVLKALALAGGVTTFAKENSIKVIRRDKHGKQIVIPFKYGRVKRGKKLSSNVLLRGGDIIVVP